MMTPSMYGIISCAIGCGILMLERVFLVVSAWMSPSDVMTWSICVVGDIYANTMRSDATGSVRLIFGVMLDMSVVPSACHAILAGMMISS